MCPSPTAPYVGRVSPRRRALTVVATSAAAMGLVLATLPRHHSAPQAVATSGPAVSLDARADPSSELTTSPPDTGSVVVGTPGTPTTHAPTTTSLSASSRTTSDVPTTAAPGTAPQPSATTATTSPVLRSLVGRVAYAEPNPSDMSVWSMLPNGTDRRLLPECPPGASGFGSDIDVSPDGTRIVRSCGAPRGSAAGTTLNGYGLVVQAVDGSSTRTIVPLAAFNAASVRWSPNGREIAVAGASGPNDPNVAIVDVATGALRRIAAVPLVGTITWSPDGTRLLMGNLIVIDVATGTTTDLATLLPDVPGAVTHFAQAARWAPSGSIYFGESAGDGTTSLVYSFDRMDPVTGTVQRLFDIPDFIDTADFLPNGRIILRWSRTQVATFGPDGGSRTLFESTYTQRSFVSARPATGS